MCRRPPAAYPTHVPLSGLQKGALAVLSAAGAALRPQRADLVATVGETSAGPALAAIKRRMLRDPEGRRVLEDRPRVREDLLASARRAPPNSFGAAYAAFMDGRGFSPDERPPVRFVNDADMAYIVARSREVHDFWHVLFACHTNVFGEVALKALEFVQVGFGRVAGGMESGFLGKLQGFVSRRSVTGSDMISPTCMPIVAKLELCLRPPHTSPFFVH